jgi:outer membrane biosynthesis protein TonB
MATNNVQKKTLRAKLIETAEEAAGTHSTKNEEPVKIVEEYESSDDASDGSEVIELEVHSDSEAEEEPKTPEPQKKTKAVKTPDAPKKARKPRVPKEKAEKPKAEKPEKRTRKPSVFNHFMKFRLAEMKEDNEIMEQYNHRERFTMAAHEWKAMTDDVRNIFKQTLATEA